MTDADLARLARALDLAMHMHPKQHPNPACPGVARLDPFSGLYLERGATEPEWLLEARTWGHPAPEAVHEWHLLTTDAAHQLDDTVSPPERLPAPPVEVAARSVDELDSPLARFRRHLVGLS